MAIRNSTDQKIARLAELANRAHAENTAIADMRTLARALVAEAGELLELADAFEEVRRKRSVAWLRERSSARREGGAA